MSLGRRQGSVVFARIAGRYDRLNALLSLGGDQRWRQRAVDLLPGGLLLDLGGGTGAANAILAGRQLVALDPSPAMIALNPASRRVVGVGEALPFADERFDAVLSAYVLRNLVSIPRTLAEIARVLRPGGRAALVDLGRPRGRLARALHRAATAVVLPVVGLSVGSAAEYAYLHRSLDKHPPPERLLADALAAEPGLQRKLRIERTWRMGPLGFVYGALLCRPPDRTA